MAKITKNKRNYNHNSIYNSNTKYYHTKKWRDMRKDYLMLNPLCENCLKNNVFNLAVHVHHKKPISSAKTEIEREFLAFDFDNLQSLCLNCHLKIHKILHNKNPEV